MKRLCALGIISVLTTASMAAQSETVSLPSTSTSRSITVYNDGFGLVREIRPIALKKGMNVVRYEGIATSIDATSVQLTDIEAPKTLSIREQNYQYDILTPLSVLQKSVGRSLRFRRLTGAGQWETLEGTLLNPPELLDQSGHYKGMVIKAKDQSIILDPQGEVTLDAVPQGLVASPSLMWKLQSTTEAVHTTEVGYLCSGMEWNADYVAVLSENSSSMNMQGWVTLKNNTGTTFANTSLQLVAGKVRRVENEIDLLPKNMAMSRMGASMGSEPPTFAEESFFEYHLYTLDGETTLQSNETKQMRLLSASDVTTKKRLVFDPMRCTPVYRQPGDGSDTKDYNAAIMVECMNSKESNMGMPLPKGKIRVYTNASDGRLQFIGEDLIQHTPVNEPLKLYLGDAFDVVATRTVKNSRSVGKRSREEVIEYTIRNQKANAEQISVVEHFGPEWEVVESTVKPRRRDASTAEFVLSVDAKSSAVLNFTVRQSW